MPQIRVGGERQLDLGYVWTLHEAAWVGYTNARLHVAYFRSEDLYILAFSISLGAVLMQEVELGMRCLITLRARWSRPSH